MRDRLDVILVGKGYAASRERARALILEGRVLVNEIPAVKAGMLVNVEADIRIRGEDIPYVGRGGLKLEAALDHFGIDLQGVLAMDIGSSTGGFTDCMLQRGASRVYCIDVGYGQLSWKLRTDPRVVLLERTNIRHLEKGRIPDTVDFTTIDVSFISLKKVLLKAWEFLRPGGGLLALVKPQFEVGKEHVAKGGIVKDEATRLAAAASVRAYAEDIGFATLGIFPSPVTGQRGNREYFLYARKP